MYLFVCVCVRMYACVFRINFILDYDMSKIGSCLCLWVSYIKLLSEGLNNELIVVNRLFCIFCCELRIVIKGNFINIYLGLIVIVGKVWGGVDFFLNMMLSC